MGGSVAETSVKVKASEIVCTFMHDQNNDGKIAVLFYPPNDIDTV